MEQCTALQVWWSTLFCSVAESQLGLVSIWPYEERVNCPVFCQLGRHWANRKLGGEAGQPALQSGRGKMLPGLAVCVCISVLSSALKWNTLLHLCKLLSFTSTPCDTAYDFTETKSTGTWRNTKAKEDRLWSQQLLVLAEASIGIKKKNNKKPTKPKQQNPSKTSICYTFQTAAWFIQGSFHAQLLCFSPTTACFSNWLFAAGILF